jgi:hypothetical protein
MKRQRSTAGLSRVGCGALVVALLMAAAGRAPAVDQPAKAAAEVLFQDALRLMKSGDFAGACPKLSQSQEIDPAVGTLLYLAECYEKTNRPASAWASYRSAQSAALNAGQPQRADVAQKRADALEPGLPRLRVEVSGVDEAGLVLALDGVQLVKAAWSVAVPVDPGEHELAASAPGRKSWSTKVVVSSGLQTVAVPALEEVEPVPAALPAANPTSQPTQDAGSSGDGSTHRAVGYFLGGAGILGLAVGAGFGLRSISKKEDSRAYCLPEDDTKCYPEGVALHDEAKTAATIANVGFIAGGAAVIGGTLLVLLAPSDRAGDDQARRVRAQPSIDNGSVGLSLHGVW